MGIFKKDENTLRPGGILSNIKVVVEDGFVKYQGAYGDKALIQLNTIKNISLSPNGFGKSDIIFTGDGSELARIKKLPTSWAEEILVWVLKQKETKQNQLITSNNTINNNDIVKANCPHCKKELPDGANFCPWCAGQLPSRDERIKTNHTQQNTRQFQPENNKTNKTQNTKRGCLGCLGIIVFFVIIVSIFGGDSEKNNEKKITDANQLIAAGKYDEAAKELATVKSTDVTQLKNDLDRIINKPYDTQIQILLSMTDEEIEATKNGTNTKQYLSNPHLNSYILDSISKMSNIAEIKEEAKIKAVQEHRLEIKKQFERKFMSSWDGSNHALEKYIKNKMNDPKSYEHIETKYIINNDEKTADIVTRFRGKNAFGGIVINVCHAKQDIVTGELLSVKLE